MVYATDLLLVRISVIPADEPAAVSTLHQLLILLPRTQELSDTEMTRGASNDDRLNELWVPEPLVGDVARPCIAISVIPR